MLQVAVELIAMRHLQPPPVPGARYVARLTSRDTEACVATSVPQMIQTDPQAGLVLVWRERLTLPVGVGQNFTCAVTSTDGAVDLGSVAVVAPKRWLSLDPPNGELLVAFVASTGTGAAVPCRRPATATILKSLREKERRPLRPGSGGTKVRVLTVEVFDVDGLAIASSKPERLVVAVTFAVREQRTAAVRSQAGSLFHDADWRGEKLTFVVPNHSANSTVTCRVRWLDALGADHVVGSATVDLPPTNTARTARVNLASQPRSSLKLRVAMSDEHISAPERMRPASAAAAPSHSPSRPPHLSAVDTPPAATPAADSVGAAPAPGGIEALIEAAVRKAVGDAAGRIHDRLTAVEMRVSGLEDAVMRLDDAAEPPAATAPAAARNESPPRVARYVAADVSGAVSDDRGVRAAFRTLDPTGRGVASVGAVAGYVAARCDGRPGMESPAAVRGFVCRHARHHAVDVVTEAEFAIIALKIAQW